MAHDDLQEPAPFTLNPDTLADLLTPRPGAVECDSADPCGWDGIPLGQGAQHTRPVAYQGLLYGSPVCAQAAHESGVHDELAALTRQAVSAPVLILRTPGATR